MVTTIFGSKTKKITFGNLNSEATKLQMSITDAVKVTVFITTINTDCNNLITRSLLFIYNKHTYYFASTFTLVSPIMYYNFGFINLDPLIP